MLVILALIATMVASIGAVTFFGIVPVGFGLEAPASVFGIGLAFVLKHHIQEHRGRLIAVGAAFVGIALATTISVHYAEAKGVGLVAATIVSVVVYSALRRFGRPASLIGGSAVANAIESSVFLLLAYGTIEDFPGMMLARGYMMALAFSVMVYTHRKGKRKDGHGAYSQISVGDLSRVSHRTDENPEEQRAPAQRG